MNLKHSVSNTLDTCKPLRGCGLVALLALCFNFNSQAADAPLGGVVSHGIYKDFVIINRSGGGNEYYQGSGGVGTFWNGLNIGSSFCSTDNLKLQGAEVNTFDGAGCGQSLCSGSC